MTEPTIICRGRLGEGCLDGQPTRRQFGEPLELTSENDGTFDGESIVCDNCYALVMPFTRSGAGLNDELDAGIAHVRSNLAFLREHPDPAVLLAAAERSAGDSSPGTPLHTSAVAAAALARHEIERREQADDDG